MLGLERVLVPLASLDKDGILSELVDLVVRSRGLEAHREAIHRAVWDREAVLSTGIGAGIALPHAKYDGLKEVLMAAGVSREPVEYGALDGQPVRLFFLILGPEAAAGSHVGALSRVSRLMRSPALRRRLVEAEDAEGFLRVIAEAERAV
jgi:mannitol/fructose-specific phosphotransferase system IIA component (Ntr-type)